MSNKVKTHGIRRLFEGFEAGHFGLPDELLLARDAADRVVAEYERVSVEHARYNPVNVKWELADALPSLFVVAKDGTGSLPKGWTRPAKASMDRKIELGTELDILAAARETVTNGLPQLAATISDEILAGHLRPALNDLLAEVRAHAKVWAVVPWAQPGFLAGANADVRDLYRRATDVLLPRYDALRQAQEQLRFLRGAPSEDAFRLAGEVRNMLVLWPVTLRNVRPNGGAAIPPWPQDKAGRLLWLSREDVETWMPTAEECEAAALEYATGLVRRDALTGVR